MERERALEIEADSATFAPKEPDISLHDDTVLKAEDIFTTPPTKDA